MIRGHRDVAVVTDAGPCLHDKSWREDVRLVNRSALFMLVAWSLKSNRAAGKAKHRLLEGILYRAAETKRESIFLAEVVVDLSIEGPTVFPELRIFLVVAGQAGEIGVGNKRKDLQRNGIHH